MVVQMAEAAPELAHALRAVYRVSRAARTREQRAAATRVTNRWTVLALAAGWSRRQIAETVGVQPASISDRARRQRQGEATMPALVGVLAVPYAPLPPRTQEQLRRLQLIAPAEVAELVGCKPGSVTYWTASRGVSHERTSRRGPRLYDRNLILAAAERRPTERHSTWQRRKNVAVPPQLREHYAATTRSA